MIWAVFQKDVKGRMWGSSRKIKPHQNMHILAAQKVLRMVRFSSVTIHISFDCKFYLQIIN